MYAAEIVDGQVVRVIVGTAEWAAANLGGIWQESDNPIPCPGAWDEINGFQQIIVDSLDDIDPHGV